MELAYVINQDNDKRRNVQLAYSHASPVEAGSYSGVIQHIDISQYPFLYVAVRSNAHHNFRVSVYYGHSNLGTLKNPNGDLIAIDIDGTTDRGVSEWVEAKGDKVSIFIYNDSEEQHTYDVYLYGVR